MVNVLKFSDSEAENVWIPSDVSMCVFASLLAVMNPFSLANVVCGVVLSGSDCEFVKPQTFLSAENAKPAKKAAAISRRPTPQSGTSPAVDVAHAWMTRYRDLIKQLVDYLARKRHNVLVDVVEQETCKNDGCRGHYWRLSLQRV